MHTLILAALLGSPAHIGLYPLDLGDAQLSARIGEELREGALASKSAAAFELLPFSSCLPDEGECLAEAGRRAQVEAIVSAAVTDGERGYRFRLREFSTADGALLRESAGEAEGGVADLRGALQRSLCEVLGQTSCAPPVAAERIVPQDALAGPLLASSAPMSIAARWHAADLLLVSGVALLAGAAGTALYANMASTEPRAAGDPAAANRSHKATLFAIGLAATGAGAIAAGGLVLALTPDAALVQGRF